MKNIAFFGGGNIAQAVIEGLIISGFKKNNIFYIDRNPLNQKKLKKLKIKNLNENSSKIDLFVIAVKPKDAVNAYKKILNDYKNPKIISFVAGIKSSKYKKINKEIEFLRAMPNTSSKFGHGITGVFNSTFRNVNLKKVIYLLDKLGTVIEFKKESEIDAFTGIVGSGPAYFYQILKSFEKKLLKLCSHDKKLVKDIMATLIKGIGASIENGVDIDNLIKMVASKKGTTEAGLNSFKSNNLNKILEEGLSAAVKRSKEISNEF